MILYYNETTKVVFGSDEAQTDPVKAITPGDVPALVAAGATVDNTATALVAPEQTEADVAGVGSDATPLSDSAAADAATPLATPNTPITDSTTLSPTGGPTAGAGLTVDAREKHGLIGRIETDLRAELTAVENLPDHVLHILAALFDRHHSAVDAAAAT